MRDLTVLLRIPCTLEISSLLLLSGLSLLYQLVMMYVGMDDFDFILPCRCSLRSLFVKINVFHQIREVFWPLFLQIFFLPLFSLFSFLDSHYAVMHILVFLLSHWSLKLCSFFFFILFASIPQSS